MIQRPIREQVVKLVVRSGNGGIVWVPKDWLGEEVIVTLPELPKLGMKERVLNVLESYLQEVVAIGIYGSYARNEQTSESDIDILVITNNYIKLNIKEKGFDVISASINKIKEAIEKYPVLYYQIIQEIRPIINARLFEELKKIKIKKDGLREYLEDTREHTKSNEELLKLDKLDYKYLKSYSVAYSSFLRLKGLFIMECILKKDIFSNKKLKQWIMGQGVSTNEYYKWYDAYKMIRDELHKKEVKIKIKTMENIIKITKRIIRELSDKIGK